MRSLSELARESVAATQTPTAPSTAPVTLVPPKRANPLRRMLLAALTVVIVATGAGVYLWRTHQQPQTVSRPMPSTLALTLSLRPKHLYCPSSITWSPDSATLAVFVLTDPTCSNGAGTRLPVVALLDARTGALKRTIDPYAALAHLNVQQAIIIGAIWSQEGKTLIFPESYNFSLVNATPASGLLYYPLDDAAPRLAQGPGAQFTDALLWDLRIGAASTLTNPLPTADSYSWTATGQLAADPAPSQAQGHVSLWQAGILQPIQPLTQDPASGTIFTDVQKPPIFLQYESATTLVSADGHFAAVNLQRGARLPATPGVAVATLDPSYCEYYRFQDICDLSAKSPPDKGFAAVATAVAAGYTYSTGASSQVFTQWNAVDLAYRPDGQVLAAVLPDAVQQGTSVKHITLFNAATGAILGTLSTQVVPNIIASIFGIPNLSWAPSGKQLAYFDYGADVITFWGGSALPA